MINNDVMRSIRYMLDISDVKMVEIIKLADFDVEKSAIVAYLKKDDEEGYEDCSDEVMAHFLDGFIFSMRGKDETRSVPPVEKRMTNNIVLKKLRVAFELKDDDMHTVLQMSGFPVSRPELSALFRKAGHKNYRVCGDQLLRNFLKGLTIHIRG